jgi:hypothetical protein
MEMASSVKYGEGKATSLGFDMQTVGKDLAYTLRNETKFCNFRRNKATAGLTFTLLKTSLLLISNLRWLLLGVQWLGMMLLMVAVWTPN